MIPMLERGYFFPKKINTASVHGNGIVYKSLKLSWVKFAPNSAVYN